MPRFMLFSMLLLSLFASKGQESMPLDEKSGRITYTAIVSQEASKQELFKRLDEWFHSYYKNPGGVIQESDSSAGKIIGKHRFNLFDITKDKKGNEISRSPGSMIQYIITTDVKAGKYRYLVTDILMLGSTKTPVEEWLNDGNEVHAEYLRQIAGYMDELIASLRKAMNASAEQKTSEF